MRVVKEQDENGECSFDYVYSLREGAQPDDDFHGTSLADIRQMLGCLILMFVRLFQQAFAWPSVPQSQNLYCKEQENWRLSSTAW